MNQVHLNFPGEGILLEGVWHFPDATRLPPAVIVCHPHPLYGGDMSNNIVITVCQALAEQSIAAFRFNFRGTGNSGGEFGGGVVEQADIRAALAVINTTPEVDSRRIGLAGYSFGAGVALPVAVQDERVKLLALVSPVLPEAGWEQLKAYLNPKYLIAGDADTFIPQERLRQYGRDIADPHWYQVVKGADHFWAGHEDEVGQGVARFFTDGFNQVQSD